jgi:ATP-binding cassette, subfamily B, bacterial
MLADRARRWPGQDLLEIWRSRSAGRSARWALVALLPRISWPLTAGAAWVVVSTAVADVLSTIASGVLVAAVPTTVQEGFSSAAGHRLVGALVVVAVLFTYQQVLGPFQRLIVESLGRRVNGALRARVMRAAFRPAGIAHLERADLLDRIRDAQGIGEGQFTPGGAVGAIVGNAATRLSVLSAAVLVASFRWWLAVVLVVFGAVVRYRLVEDMLRSARSSVEHTEGLRRADYLRQLATTPEAAKETRVFGLGGWLLARFKQQWLGAMELIWSERRDRDAASWSWSLPWGALMAWALWLIGRGAARGELSLEAMAIAVQACLQAGTIWIGNNDIQLAYGATAVPAAIALDEALADPTIALVGSVDPSERPQREIRMDAVRFRYAGRDDDVYHALDLVIPARQSLAIVGANGAGKTTLVKLLARLYDPTAGRITVDGTDLRDLDARAWQRRVAAIFQDFVHYELSARDNVAFGAVDRRWTDSELDAIAAKVGATDIIARLPRGWDTVLSRQFTDGVDLSGGQWQRIALARALCAVEAGASVLILDEPTSNLDVRAEAELFDRFLDLTRGVTTILISHRFSSVRHADRICVLASGQIVEQGTHAELLAAGGHYARLFRLQAARFTSSSVDEATSA